MIKIKYKYVAIGGYLYAIIPILVFFMGWFKFYESIVLSLILIYGFVYMIKKDYIKDDREIHISKKMCLILLGILLLWIYLSGPGGGFFETWDFHTKNAIFRDLIQCEWPVIYSKTNNALVYYFAQWLIPALFGKVFGWTVANIVLAITSYIGIIIVYLLLIEKVKAKTPKQLLVLCAVLITWGGLNNLGAMTTTIIGKGNYLLGNSDGWMDIINGYQYSSNDTLLAWVFNQTLVPWIMTLLALESKKIRNFAFIGLCVFPFGPFPFVGLALILIIIFVHRCIENIKQKNNFFECIIKEVFSVPNICSIIAIFIPFTLFFKCNVVTGFLQFYIPLNKFGLNEIFTLLYFAFIEYGIYSIVIMDKYRKNYLFIIINILLLLFPLFSVGPSRDFLMRASIPELFCIMIYVIEYLINNYNKNSNSRVIILIILLSISSVNFLGELSQKIVTIRTTGEFPVISDDTKTLSNMNIGDDNPNTFEENYIVPNWEETVFFKYLAKSKK